MSSNILSISLSLTNPPRRIPIEIKSDANAKSLFEAASKATHIPTAGMKLIFRGRIIANKGDGDEMNVIEEFKLEDRSVIHCMGKPNPPSVDADANVNVAATSATTNSGSTVIPPAASASASAPSIAVSSNPLKSSLQQMKSSHPGIDYKIGLTTLSKLLQNVIQNPMEQKYRKVKKTNAAFQKKLGRLNGANEAILAIGFQTVGEEYVLTPSPEAWPALLESKATLDQAVRDYEAQQSRPMPAATGDMGFGGMPNLGMGMGAGAGAGMPGMGGMNMPPGMEQAMSSILSDPQALQNMLNDPMVQNMMQNHPQFANNPMAQQQMRTLANNPQMLQQMSQMMSNPQMMSRMQQMMQNNGAMGAMGAMGGMGNHTNANNTGMPAAGSGSAMDMNRQMEIMRQFANMNNANANASTNGAASGGASGNQNTNNAGSNNTNNNGGSDGQMTEEEMIAAAIARSLREQ